MSPPPSTILQFQSRVFRLAKDVDHPEQDQDSCRIDEARGVAAIADGVASGIFSRQWAAILTEAVLADLPDPDNRESFARWLTLRREAWAAGIDVLLDDRDQRAGVKFKDADLVGFPLRVVIGERGLKQGKLEVKWRWDDKSQMIDVDGAVEQLAAMIREERTSGSRFNARRKV